MSRLGHRITGAAYNLVATLLWCALAAGPARAQELVQPAREPTADTTRVECEFALVFSGGGARGMAHLGVLEVFEEYGIVPDCVAGASMGSIIGALYASGHEIAQIRQLLGVFSWRTLYLEPNNRSAQPILHRLESQRSAVRIGFLREGLRFPRSALNDGMVNHMLIEHLAPANFEAGRDFAALPIPFRTVATDLKSGQRIVLAKGDLARAVRASMSVPLAYAPVQWGNALLVDGGLVDNIPVSLALEMGATYTVAVDASTPVSDEVRPDLVGVTERIIDLLYTARNNENQVAPDLMIRPDLGDHNFADYSDYEALLSAGRAAALAAVESIPDRFKHRRRARRPRHDPFAGRRILEIVISGHEYLPEQVLARELDLQLGSMFDFRTALRSLDRLYSSGLLQEAWIDIRPRGDGVMLELHVVEQYRHTADFGLAYQDDDQAQGFLRLETRSPLGSSERFRLTGYASTGDLYGSVGLRGVGLFGAHLGYKVEFQAHDDKPRVFDSDGGFVRRALFRRRHISATFDIPFGTRHLLEAGFRIGSVKIHERLGLPYAQSDDTQRVILGRYVWDDLDSLMLPRRGRFLRVLAEHNIESLGATLRYSLVDVYGVGVRQIGPVILQGRLRYGYSTGALPVYERFRIGGPELIPGVSREELWGNQALAASVTMGADVSSLLRLYARAGLGNVWERPRDISLSDTIVGVGVGATLATPIGPIQLDYGWADGGRNQLSVSFGWQSRGIRDVSR